jgi:hypothetical protein
MKKYKYSRKNIARSIQRCSSLQIADIIKKMVIENLLATKPEKVPEPTVFKPWRKFLKDEAISVKVKVTPSKKSDKRKAKLLEEYLNTKFEDNILVKHLSSDNSGATPDDVTHFKHTAKVRPQYISCRKVHKLQELLETNTCGGTTQIRVLDDFWNWSEEVTEKLNQILNYLHL